jgi:hypothetical protein
MDNLNNSKRSNSLLILTIAAGVILIGLLAFVAYRILDKSKTEDNTDLKTSSSISQDSVKTSGNTQTAQDKVSNNKKVNPVISSAEAVTFVNQWAAYQSAINIPAYTNCYSLEFRGVKRTKSGREYTYDYSGWISDRTKMYAKQSYIVLNAENVTLTKYDANTRVAEVNFWQTYKTKKYSDDGQKFIHLKKNADGEIKIVYEELKYSLPEGVTEGD